MFSEVVTGVDADDFSLAITGVTGAIVANVTGSGDTYTVTVNSGSGDGTIRLDIASGNTITDVASNPLGSGFTNGDMYTFDKTAPTVSITPLSNNPTNGGWILFQITFSESVSGVDVGNYTPESQPNDFSLAITGLSNVYIGNVYSSLDHYVVGVLTGTGYGTIRLDVIADGMITDAAGNPLNGNYTGDITYTIDKIPPTVLSVVRSSASPTNATSVNFTVTFSEIVTGVDAADFSLFTSGISGASITSVSGSGASYTVAVNTGSGSGTIRLDVVANGTIKDSVNNTLNNGFAGGEIYAIDKTPPSVLSITLASPNPTSAAYVSFTVTFSEAVTGVDVSDFGLASYGLNGQAVVSVSGSGTTYTVVVYTGHGTGLLRLRLIDNDSIMDVAGNPLGGIGAGNGNYLTGETYTVFR